MRPLLRLATLVTLVTLAPVGCGQGTKAHDAAADGAGGGSWASGGSTGSGGMTAGAAGGSGVAGRGGSGPGGASGGRGGGGSAGNPGPGGTGGGAGASGGRGGGGTGGSASGGDGGGDGNPAGVSYLGCTFIGGIHRVVVSKRDTAGNQCLSFALAEAGSMPQSTPGLTLPAGWQLERVTTAPASSCPMRIGTPVSGQVTGTISWAELRPGAANFPMRVNVNVTLTIPANNAGASSVEQIDGQNIDVVPDCDAAPTQCSFALPLRCGDRLDHSTLTQGRPSVWSGYSLTARGLSGRETVYAFASARTCTVEANLKNLTTDLDLLLLSGCDPIRSNEVASSTPLDLQTIETVRWTNLPDQISYVVVDGYAGAEGSYSLEVDCTCR